MGNGPFIEAYPLKNGDFPWQTVSHNQMVSPFSGQVIHPFFDSSYKQHEVTGVTRLGPSNGWDHR